MSKLKCQTCETDTSLFREVFGIRVCPECYDNISDKFNYSISDNFIKGGIELLEKGT